MRQRAAPKNNRPRRQDGESQPLTACSTPRACRPRPSPAPACPLRRPPARHAAGFVVEFCNEQIRPSQHPATTSRATVPMNVTRDWQAKSLSLVRARLARGHRRQRANAPVVWTVCHGSGPSMRFRGMRRATLTIVLPSKPGGRARERSPGPEIVNHRDAPALHPPRADDLGQVAAWGR